MARYARRRTTRRSTRRTTRARAAPRRSYARRPARRRAVSRRRGTTPRTIKLVIQTVSASPLLGSGNQMVKGAQVTRRLF